MSVATSYSAHLVGIEALPVTIEVDVGNGLNAFALVGLGDRSVNEAKDRICAAIKNSGYISPKQKNQKVVISLAPADRRKEGTAFDLAMAIAYLAATGDLPLAPEKKLFFGELSLEGNIRRVPGILPILCQVKRFGFDTVFIPEENLAEASLAHGLTIYPAASLGEVICHLQEKHSIEPLGSVRIESRSDQPDMMDMANIRGNESAKRALEIAAAGAHNILLYGPPGTGKTMLARSFPSILPRLSHEHSVEVTGIHSLAGTLNKGLICHPPFRAPHHTASYPSIVGGGAVPRPGEVTLAHRGILFLDELPEFDRTVIEALREPLESGHITISRARGTVTYPAGCLLLAAMNPCPCGKGLERGCTCPAQTIEAYRRKISGPIMDRIDLWINVDKVDYDKLASLDLSEESSSAIRSRVEKARDAQKARFADLKKPVEDDGFGNSSRSETNSGMLAKDIDRFASLEPEARSTLVESTRRLAMSGRAFHRVIRVARTIADLAHSQNIRKVHLLEALQYRQKILG